MSCVPPMYQTNEQSLNSKQQFGSITVGPIVRIGFHDFFFLIDTIWQAQASEEKGEKKTNHV